MSGNLTYQVALDVLPGDEPAAGDWTDLTGRLAQPVSVRPTTVTLEDDDRTFDPTAGGTGDLVRHARLIGHANSSDLPVWRGLTDVWSPHWEAGLAYCRVEHVDALAWCALQDVDVDLPRQYPQERIGALLDLADWPATLRDLGVGKVLLEPVEVDGGNVVRMIEDAVDAEQGRLWVGPSGEITFRGRHQLLDLPVAATIGDGGLSLVNGIDPEHDTFRLTNRVRVELADGETHVVGDVTSVANRGPRTDTVRDLAYPWYEALGRADWDVFRFKDRHTWFTGVKVDVATPDHLETVLGLSPADRVTFAATVRGVQAQFDCIIETVSHEVVTGGWTATLDLSPYHGQGPWFTPGDPTFGVLGAGNRLAP